MPQKRHGKSAWKYPPDSPQESCVQIIRPYSDSGRHHVCLFSACANEIIRLHVRLRRLGTVGITCNFLIKQPSFRSASCLTAFSSLMGASPSSSSVLSVPKHPRKSWQVFLETRTAHSNLTNVLQKQYNRLSPFVYPNTLCQKSQSLFRLTKRGRSAILLASEYPFECLWVW